MRQSFSHFMRIIPKANISPTTTISHSSFKPTTRPTILPPPLTRREEAPTRTTVIQTLLKRKTDGLAKEEKGELAKGAGWPVNLRVERITKNMGKAERDMLKET